MAKKNKKKNQIVKTEVKYLPITARKLRLVVESVKKMAPQQAIRKLNFMNKKGATYLKKAIKTVLADAETNFGLDKSKLTFEEIIVNEGPTRKKRDKSHGARFHFGVIRKRKSHLVVKVKESK